MRDFIGAMRARVMLQRPTRVTEEIGGAAIAWSDEGSVWAEIAEGGAGESAAFDTAPSTSGYRVTIRERNDVRAGWRVVWGGRVLRVVGVSDAGAPRITLSCEEERL